MELLERSDLSRDEPKRDGNISLLKVGVTSKSSGVFKRVRKINFFVLEKELFVFGGQKLAKKGKGTLGRELRLLEQRHGGPRNADNRVTIREKMEVRGSFVDGCLDKGAEEVFAHISL